MRRCCCPPDSSSTFAPACSADPELLEERARPRGRRAVGECRSTRHETPGSRARDRLRSGFGRCGTTPIRCRTATGVRPTSAPATRPRPAVGLHACRENADGGRLPRPVGTQQPEELAGSRTSRSSPASATIPSPSRLCTRGGGRRPHWTAPTGLRLDRARTATRRAVRATPAPRYTLRNPCVSIAALTRANIPAAMALKQRKPCGTPCVPQVVTPENRSTTSSSSRRRAAVHSDRRGRGDDPAWPAVDAAICAAAVAWLPESAATCAAWVLDAANGFALRSGELGDAAHDPAASSTRVGGLANSRGGRRRSPCAPP